LTVRLGGAMLRRFSYASLLGPTTSRDPAFA
jgi:hypothetical protein